MSVEQQEQSDPDQIIYSRAEVIGFLSAVVRVLLVFGTVIGIVIAAYWFLLPSIVETNASSEAAAQHQQVYGWVPPDHWDRLIGIVFGFGLSVVSLLGLSVLVRRS